MIKLFAWEPRILAKLKQKRGEELQQIRKERLLEIVMFALNDLIPLLAGVGTMAAYVSLMGYTCRLKGEH